MIRGVHGLSVEHVIFFSIEWGETSLQGMLPTNSTLYLEVSGSLNSLLSAYL